GPHYVRSPRGRSRSNSSIHMTDRVSGGIETALDKSVPERVYYDSADLSGIRIPDSAADRKAFGAQYIIDVDVDKALTEFIGGHRPVAIAAANQAQPSAM